MVDNNETRVIYRAIADFSALTREVRQARHEIRRLREEEARLNAQSAAANRRQNGNQSRIANGGGGNGNNRTTVVGGGGSGGNNRNFRGGAQQVLAQAAAQRQHAGAVNQTARATRNLGNAAQAAAPNLNRVAHGTQQVAHSATRAGRGMQNAGRHMSNTRKQAGWLSQSIYNLDKRLDKLGNWRPHLIPPFVALVPIILGLLGLINPLVAGFGALGAAAIGFASSIGRVAGAALGAIPALFSLLSVVAALKVAFGGIGGAFKAFSKTKAGGGGGGGGGGSRKAELTQQEKIQRALEAYRRAVEDVKFAEEDLDDARKDYLKRLRDLQKAVDRIAMSEARAAANVQLARENYANILADPGSTKGQKMEGKVGVDESIAEQSDLIDENKELVAELTEMKLKGMEGDRQVIMATRALTDAINRQRDAELDLINARRGADKAGGGASAADEYRKALEKLSPSARKFVEILTGMKGAWDEVRKSVQEAFFSEFVDNVARLRGLLPAVKSLLSDTAGAVGRVVDKFLLMVTSPEWKSDLILLGKGNVPIIERIGAGLLSLMDMFKDLTVVAQPFFSELARMFRDWAAGLNDLVAKSRKNGSLADWLIGGKDGKRADGSQSVLATLQQWIRIVGNLGKTIFNYMKAAGPFADWLTGSLEAMTERWLKNSEKAVGPGSSFRKWLEDVKPLLSEIGGMFGDLWRWIKGESTDTKNIEQMIGLIQSLRTELGPAIARFLDHLTDNNAGQGLVDMFTKIFEILDELASTGATQAFFDTINVLLDIVKELVKLPFAKWLIAAMGPLAAFTTIYKFTGLSKLVSAILSLNKAGGVPGLLSRIWAKLSPFATFAGLPVGYQPRNAVGGLVQGGRSTGTYAPLGGAKAQRGLVPGSGTRVAQGARSAGGIVTGGKAGSRAIPRGGSVAGRIGKGLLRGGGLAGGIAGIAGTLAGDYISSSAAEGKAGSGQRLGGNVLSGAASGAGLGAMIGSIIPGIGTGIGAGVGGVIGGVAGAMGTDEADLAQVGSDISKWWNETVVPAWTGAADAVGQWWNDYVVVPFQTAASDVSTWWNDNVVTPFTTAAADVAAWWDMSVVQPWNRLAGTLGEIWNLYVVVPFTAAASAVQTWWNESVVIPFQNMAAQIGLWWNDNVVVPFQTMAAQVGTWWHENVVLPFQRIASQVGTWWHENVVLPFQRMAAQVGKWWDDNVVKPFQKAAADVGKWWNDNVVKPFQKAATDIANWWNDNVIKPFSNTIEGIKKGWDGFWREFGKFNLIDAVNNFLRRQFLPGRPQADHNGGVIHRAGGGNVPGRGNSDTVPAMLTPGEFVLRKAIVNRIGLDNLVKLNSGIMSYAQLLQQAAKDKSKQDGLPSQFFNVGGLVPDMPGWNGKGTPPAGPSFGGFGGQGGAAPVIAGDLVINNPAPEPASDSLPRSIRKVAYLGGRK